MLGVILCSLTIGHGSKNSLFIFVKLQKFLNLAHIHIFSSLLLKKLNPLFLSFQPIHKIIKTQTPQKIISYFITSFIVNCIHCRVVL